MNEPLEVETQLYFAIAKDNGWWISYDFRIGLKDAASMLGISYGHLRNLIAQGKGPRVCQLGGGGHRVTVKLRALAEWVESRSI